MEYRKLGNSDITVSVISFGAWSIGGQPFWENKDDKVSISAIKKAFDSGINLFDTAPVYGFGHSEEIIGKALKKYRKEVIIVTKCGLRWNNNKVYHNLKKDSILEEIDLSLKRLKTDFIDLYQVHWPDPDTPIEETMTALKKIQESGKIRYIGVSNFTVPMMKECLKYAEIISLQPGYNLFDRKIEKDIIPFCIENNIGIIAYSPLASGILTGKYNKKTKFKDWRGKFGEMFKKDVYPGLIDKTEKLKNYLKITNRKLHHLAIKWVIIQKGITSAIVGANTPEQVEDNIKALNLKISENDLN
ncbi:aldo/keto reductase, partial [candidate division KSB1 bacterium]